MLNVNTHSSADRRMSKQRAMHPTRRVVRESGFTLIEALIVIVLVGILSALAYPKLTGASARNSVRAARGQAISLYAKARAAAIETNRSTTLNFNATRAWITATPALLAGHTVDTIGQVENMAASYGVAMTYSPAGTLTIDPRGLGSSSVTTVWLRRNGFTDSMVVSGFGRVIK
jgi:prepilin-type N-terminal cleavage/methylation domain-containing protein